MRPVAAVFAALALGGCAAGGLPLRETVAVPAGRFEAVQGQAEVVVRSFITDEAGQTRELGGASCEVTSILFSTRLQTPGRVVFPGFGPQSPTLDIDCRAGELAGSAEVAVEGQWVRMPGAWPGPGPWPYGYGGWGGPWGGPWAGGAWGGGPSYVTFVYPDVNVPLR